MKVISFYKYIAIDEPEVLCDNIRAICTELEIVGRILIGKEGINAAVSGTEEAIESFKDFIQSKFSDLTFREQDVPEKTYHKLVVRARDEIVVLGASADLENAGKHISPEELKEMLDNEEDIVILDARNDYEYKVGKFKKALTLPIESFKELPEEMKKREDLKEKKIVMYCTGGVRCEKASAYLKEQGFKDVNQLQGGIINYLNKVGSEHYEGSCFVFDDRLATQMGDPISECVHCGEAWDTYINCHNLDCDKLFLNCESCQKETKNCSETCRQSPKQRPEIQKPKKILGKVTNYYVKSKIAEVKLNEDLKENIKVMIKGKTTDFEQEIKSIKVHEDGLVTFPVDDRVRENDLILIENEN